MIAANQRVGDRVPLPVADDAVKSIVVHKPDGAAVTIAREAGVFRRNRSTRRVYHRHAGRRVVVCRQS